MRESGKQGYYGLFLQIQSQKPGTWNQTPGLLKVWIRQRTFSAAYIHFLVESTLSGILVFNSVRDTFLILLNIFNYSRTNDLCLSLSSVWIVERFLHGDTSLAGWLVGWSADFRNIWKSKRAVCCCVLSGFVSASCLDRRCWREQQSLGKHLWKVWK